MPKKNRRKLSTFRIILELIILTLFIIPMFNLNRFTGIVYIITIVIAFYKGLIFRRKNIAIMIIIGTLLAYIAGSLIPYAVGTYIAGDIISAAIIAILALLIWSKSRKLRKGKK